MDAKTYTVTEIFLSLPGDSDVGDYGITTVMQLPSEIDVNLIQLHTICNQVKSALTPFLGSDLTVTAHPIEEAITQSEKLIADWDQPEPNPVVTDEEYGFEGDDFAYDSRRERSYM